MKAVMRGLVLLLAAATFACREPVQNKYSDAIGKLKPLHTELGEPGPSDWLANHHEPGQTFAQYLQSDPVTPTGARKAVYVQPIGDFTEKQRKVIDLSAEYMGLYFNVEVKVNDDLDLDMIPPKARRVHPSWKVPQLLSTYILDEVLQPRVADDAAALIAFTAIDLWPGRGWNFVFGQASLQERVGVWSIYRNGDPETKFKTFVLRTLKTATHETGHMFSIQHCTAFECNMCGSNTRAESDRHPLWLCPECVAKVVHASGDDFVGRYTRLERFCRANGLAEEAEFFARSSRALQE